MKCPKHHAIAGQNHYAIGLLKLRLTIAPSHVLESAFGFIVARINKVNLHDNYALAQKPLLPLVVATRFLIIIDICT
jgi:hypothetical protein